MQHEDISLLLQPPLKTPKVKESPLKTIKVEEQDEVPTHKNRPTPDGAAEKAAEQKAKRDHQTALAKQEYSNNRYVVCIQRQL